LYLIFNHSKLCFFNIEFEQYARRSLDSYVTKYSTINGVVKKAMQANLPENEVDSLYSQVHRLGSILLFLILWICINVYSTYFF